MKRRRYDVNADLCAAKNYHDTMVAHGRGTDSVLVLPEREDERCFCIGTPGEAAAAGSPFVEKCTAAHPVSGLRGVLLDQHADPCVPARLTRLRLH